MAKIKLMREDASDVDDERDPWILEVSRVPCKGEVLHANEAPPSRHGRRGPGFFEVVMVIHEAGFGGALAATVWIKSRQES